MLNLGVTLYIAGVKVKAAVLHRLQLVVAQPERGEGVVGWVVVTAAVMALAIVLVWPAIEGAVTSAINRISGYSAP